jgi:hypothetical protein
VLQRYHTINYVYSSGHLYSKVLLMIFLSMYVREFFILVFVSFFVTNKFHNVQNLLVLVPKVKIHRKI